MLGMRRSRTLCNECKNRKNNKIIETLGSLDYIELSEDEALDLALGNNKRIVEIIKEMNMKKVIMKKLAI